MKISGAVITLNEEHNIEECLLSLKKVCDEIVVVDSNSNDKTVEIAKRLGAKVILQPYLGDGHQKNVAAEHTSHEWVLTLDADERLDDELVEEIRQLDLEKTNKEAFSARRKNYIGTRWIKCCGWYPDYNTRLYRKTKARFKPVEGHAYVVAEKVGKLKGHIVHYSYRNYEELLYKTNRFSTRGAHILNKRGKKVTPLTPPLHFMSAFIRKYIFQRGFTQGLDGLTIALTASINSYMKYAKLLEMQREDHHSDSLWEQ